MLIGLCEWAALADEEPGGRDRVEEGTGVHVDKHSKEILIHLGRDDGITANGRLDAATEAHDVCSEIHSRVERKIQSVIGRIAILDRVRRRNGDLTALVTDLKETTRLGEFPDVKMEGGRELSLERRAWRRKLGSSRRRRRG